MNKQEFLKELNQLLKALPSRERQDILQDYEEHFIFGQEAGKTETEIINALGSPKKLAKELLANYHVEQVHSSRSLTSVIRTLFIIAGLGFFNLFFFIFIAFAWLLLLFSFWLAAGLLMAIPFLYVINVMIHPSVFSFFELFVSLACLGAGYFLALLLWFITKFTKNLLIRYLKFNFSLVKGAK